jgi:hypothetical protein
VAPELFYQPTVRGFESERRARRRALLQKRKQARQAPVDEGQGE